MTFFFPQIKRSDVLKFKLLNLSLHKANIEKKRIEKLRSKANLKAKKN